MLFTRSPVLRAQMEYQQYGLQIPPEGADNTSCCTDSYAGFSLDALSSIPSNQNMYLLPGTASTRDNSQSSTSQESDYGSFSAFADMASSSKSNFFAAANSASFSSASDGYGNFDAFAAAARFPADESRELAARQAQFVSLSRSPTRPKTQGWGTEDQHDEDSVYGSFASANVTSPSTPVLPVTIKALSSSSMSANSSSDYGSFASMASSESFDAFSTGSSSESTLPQWTAALGPPPSPPRSILLRPSPSKAPQPDDVYGSFSSLTIADHRESPSDNESMMSSTVSLPNLLTSDDTSRSSSDSGDETKSAPATTITDISASTPSLSLSHPPQGSALEELNAGMTFYKQKQLDEAILRFVVAREIARETGDKVVEARALGNLGTVYLDRKSARQAVECYEKCLEITRSIGDTKRERTILNNLVLAFVACDEFAEALAFCQVQLEMTSNDINRRKILSRMSLLRERMTRAATVKREVEASAAFA
jgi:tetratricopeptide (TPR) repeat protein